MNTRQKLLVVGILSVILSGAMLQAQQQLAIPPIGIVGQAITRIAAIVEPPADAQARMLSARVEVRKATGAFGQAEGASLELAIQAPDRLRLSARVEGREYRAGRDGRELWIHAPAKKFGVVGAPGVPLFAGAPDLIDQTVLPPMRLPLTKEALGLMLLTLQAEARPAETLDGVACHVIRLTPRAGVNSAIKLPAGELELAIRVTDSLPARVRVKDDRGSELELLVHDIELGEPWALERWKLQAAEGEHVERTAVGHLVRFIDTLFDILNNQISTLGPATGERRLVAAAGEGRLEDWDGTRVLFLKGSPQAMGTQHGTLLKKQVRSVVDRMVYGIGVGSSFESGSWFMTQVEQATKRVSPFVPERYFAEMDAMAAAAGIHPYEMRLAQFFPELFHCSGFAIFGDSTVGGRMYHGRILDYLRGVGLEQNAVVTVYQGEGVNAWVNVGYAGFIGSVTAMNDKHIALGEMGGRGEGNWDGKPMAQLVREVMEQASTLEQAVEIMRKGPRTCEYYYVISDGKTRKAVGIKATPEKFETVWPGESHPLLPHAVKDAVLVSAGGRYEKLVERVKSGYGKFDDAAARALMDPPVCMSSNIHSVLFAPETLDFWVANADSKNVASRTRYTHYNLGEMLKGQPAAVARP